MYILVIAAVMLYLTNRFFDLKNLLNPFVFFYLYQTVFCFIALSYHHMYRLKIDPELIQLIIWAYILTFVGAFASRYLFEYLGVKYVRYGDLRIKSQPSRSFLLSGFIVFLLGVIIFLYFTYKTGGIIIFADEVENSRIEKRKGAGMINLLFIAFIIYSYLVCFINYNLSRGIKVLLFLIAGFSLLSFGSRAPFIKLILAMFLLYGIFRQKKFSIKTFAIIATIALSIVVVLGSLRTNQAEGIDFLRILRFRAGWRPYVNIQNLQRIYDFFPEQHNYMLGYSYLLELKIFLPGNNPNFGTYLKDVMDWQFEGGSITPTFLGVGYLNFGKSAFIIYPLIFGFVFNSIYQVLCLKNLINNTKVIFLILFSIGISGSLSTGLFPAFIANTIFLIFTLLVHLGIKQLLLKKPLRFNFE